MQASPVDVTMDLPLALVLFAIIASAVFLTKTMKNVWVNRKIIHLSVTPAVLAYMYAFREPYVFFAFALFFTTALSIPHFRSRESA
jgi:hypothetical protein